MEPLPLVGLTEIAQRAGVQKAAVAMWRARHSDTFPTPVAELRTGAVFWWPEIQHWLEQTGRRFDENWTLEQTSRDTRPGRLGR